MEDSDIALKKIAKGAGIFSIGLFISKVLAYAYRLIIARIGIEQYGLISIALAVFNILIVIALLGMGEGVIRFVSFYKGRTDQRRIKGVITSALKFTLPLSLVFAAFLFFSSDWVAVTFFHDIQLGILFKIFAFGIPLDVLRSIFFSAIKAFQKVEYEVYAKSIAENISKVILTLVVVYLGFGIVGATVAYVLSIFISFVLAFYSLEKKVFPIISTNIISIRSDKELLVYSLPLLLTGFVYLIIQWTDTLMLGGLRTVSEVGVYNVALPTASLLYLFPSAIRTLFFPVLSELYAQNKKDVFKSVCQTVIKWVLIIESIIFIFLIVFSYQIIHTLFGNAYVQDKVHLLSWNIPLSILALIILAVGMLPGEFLAQSRDMLLVLKKTKLIFLNTLVGSTLNIILNYILIPHFGIIGAAIATGLAYFTITLMITIEAYVLTKINPFKHSCIKIGLIALTTLLAMISLKIYLINNLVYMMLAGLCFLIVYFGLLLVFKSFDNEDIMIINSILQKLGIQLDKVLGKFI